MKFGIAQRVALAFGVLLFLFFITSAVSFLMTTRMRDDVNYLTGPVNAQAKSFHLLQHGLAASVAARRRQV